ncbi:hypothetical protein VD0001_g1187 [Verticillium dahliae]|nr:hypothetical protein VD0001_g1187 [Verticillium dahliae]
MHTIVQPNEWVAVKLPNESIRIIQVIPNTTISLGKYGSFPSNLIIERPYHLTYEVQDRRDDENFNRLRVVPASELHADVIAEENGEKAVPDESAEGDANADNDASAPTSANVVAVEDGADFTLVDKASGTVIAREGRDKIEAEARQLLTQQEIETLKKRDTDGGRDIIAKLLLSHTSLDEKTTFSLAKYKILKNKKYLRRFSVQPLYASTLGQFVLEEKEPSKIMEMRHEALALLGCWGHVHYGGEEIEGTPKVVANNGKPVVEASQLGGRWLVVDDTGGLVVASVAERMGILHQDLSQHNVGNGLSIRATTTQDAPQSGAADATPAELTPADTPAVSTPADDAPSNPATAPANGTSYPTRTYRDDFEIDLASSNTITLLHSANQPNLALLKYWNCDMANPPPTTSSHPLFNRLFPLSWLQLIEPESDTTYASFTDDIPEETLSGFKASRRGNYHRKRRRWARTRFIVDQARAGGFSGLVVASTMDPISVVRAALPLLAGGAPISIYSPTIEPLTQLADCFSKARRAAWSSNPPTDDDGAPLPDLENWPGSDDFPINPSLLIGPNVQTSRAKRWQVLPGRTHPLMMGRGGAEGFLFTGSKAVPAEGKIEARGKTKRRKVEA